MLLQAAVFRPQVLHLFEQVQRQGDAFALSLDELDDCVTNSVGLRWAVNGPFSSFYMGGGPTGFHGYFKQFGPGMKTSWVNHSPIEYSDELAQLIIDQGDKAYADFARDR